MEADVHDDGVRPRVDDDVPDEREMLEARRAWERKELTTIQLSTVGREERAEVVGRLVVPRGRSRIELPSTPEVQDDEEEDNIDFYSMATFTRRPGMPPVSATVSSATIEVGAADDAATDIVQAKDVSSSESTTLGGADDDVAVFNDASLSGAEAESTDVTTSDDGAANDIVQGDGGDSTTPSDADAVSADAATSDPPAPASWLEAASNGRPPAFLRVFWRSIRRLDEPPPCNGIVFIDESGESSARDGQFSTSRRITASESERQLLFTSLQQAREAAEAAEMEMYSDSSSSEDESATPVSARRRLVLNDEPLPSSSPTGRRVYDLERAARQRARAVSSTATRQKGFQDQFCDSAVAKWSTAQLRAWAQRHDNPNAFYYRFTELCFHQSMGSLTQEEEAIWMARYDQFKSSGWRVGSAWGIFSLALPHKVGYQCSNHYRKLLREGVLADPTYGWDEHGQFRQLRPSEADESETYGQESEERYRRTWEQEDVQRIEQGVNESIRRHFPHFDTGPGYSTVRSRGRAVSSVRRRVIANEEGDEEDDGEHRKRARGGDARRGDDADEPLVRPQRRFIVDDDEEEEEEDVRRSVPPSPLRSNVASAAPSPLKSAAPSPVREVPYVATRGNGRPSMPLVIEDDDFDAEADADADDGSDLPPLTALMTPMRRPMAASGEHLTPRTPHDKRPVVSPARQAFSPALHHRSPQRSGRLESDRSPLKSSRFEADTPRSRHQDVDRSPQKSRQVDRSPHTTGRLEAHSPHKSRHDAPRKPRSESATVVRRKRVVSGKVVRRAPKRFADASVLPSEKRALSDREHKKRRLEAVLQQIVRRIRTRATSAPRTSSASPSPMTPPRRVWSAMRARTSTRPPLPSLLSTPRGGSGRLLGATQDEWPSPGRPGASPRSLFLHVGVGGGLTIAGDAAADEGFGGNGDFFDADADDARPESAFAAPEQRMFFAQPAPPPKPQPRGFVSVPPLPPDASFAGSSFAFADLSRLLTFPVDDVEPGAATAPCDDAVLMLSDAFSRVGVLLQDAAKDMSLCESALVSIGDAFDSVDKLVRVRLPRLRSLDVLRFRTALNESSLSFLSLLSPLLPWSRSRALLRCALAARWRAVSALWAASCVGSEHIDVDVAASALFVDAHPITQAASALYDVIALLFEQPTLFSLTFSGGSRLASILDDPPRELVVGIRHIADAFRSRQKYGHVEDDVVGDDGSFWALFRPAWQKWAAATLSSAHKDVAAANTEAHGWACIAYLAPLARVGVDGHVLDSTADVPQHWEFVLAWLQQARTREVTCSVSAVRHMMLCCLELSRIWAPSAEVMAALWLLMRNARADAEGFEEGELTLPRFVRTLATASDQLVAADDNDTPLIIFVRIVHAQLERLVPRSDMVSDADRAEQIRQNRQFGRLLSAIYLHMPTSVRYTGEVAATRTLTSHCSLLVYLAYVQRTLNAPATLKRICGLVDMVSSTDDTCKAIIADSLAVLIDLADALDLPTSTIITSLCTTISAVADRYVAAERRRFAPVTPAIFASSSISPATSRPEDAPWGPAERQAWKSRQDALENALVGLLGAVQKIVRRSAVPQADHLAFLSLSAAFLNADATFPAALRRAALYIVSSVLSLCRPAASPVQGAPQVYATSDRDSQDSLDAALLDIDMDALEAGVPLSAATSTSVSVSVSDDGMAAQVARRFQDALNKLLVGLVHSRFRKEGGTIGVQNAAVPGNVAGRQHARYRADRDVFSLAVNVLAEAAPVLVLHGVRQWDDILALYGPNSSWLQYGDTPEHRQVPPRFFSRLLDVMPLCAQLFDKELVQMWFSAHLDYAVSVQPVFTSALAFGEHALPTLRCLAGVLSGSASMLANPDEYRAAIPAMVQAVLVEIARQNEQARVLSGPQLRQARAALRARIAHIPAFMQQRVRELEVRPNLQAQYSTFAATVVGHLMITCTDLLYDRNESDSMLPALIGEFLTATPATGPLTAARSANLVALLRCFARLDYHGDAYVRRSIAQTFSKHFDSVQLHPARRQAEQQRLDAFAEALSARDAGEAPRINAFRIFVFRAFFVRLLSGWTESIDRIVGAIAALRIMQAALERAYSGSIDAASWAAEARAICPTLLVALRAFRACANPLAAVARSHILVIFATMARALRSLERRGDLEAAAFQWGALLRRVVHCLFAHTIDHTFRQINAHRDARASLGFDAHYAQLKGALAGAPALSAMLAELQQATRDDAPVAAMPPAMVAPPAGAAHIAAMAFSTPEVDALVLQASCGLWRAVAALFGPPLSRKLISVAESMTAIALINGSPLLVHMQTHLLMPLGHLTADALHASSAERGRAALTL